MLATLKLLLPALIPSWRFFDTIAPSPRIEFRLDNMQDWQEFRPRPVHLPIGVMLKRMFWNPHWNETLFLVSCAERLMQNPTEHSSNEIAQRIRSELSAKSLQFRLVYVSREGAQLQKHITFISPVYVYEP